MSIGHKPLNIAIAGAGRMAQAIARVAADRDDLQVSAIWVRAGRSECPEGLAPAVSLSSDLDSVVATADVVIDFSLPQATGQVLAAAVAADKALVCGVSGLDRAAMQALADAAVRIPVVYDRNMSLGIAVLEQLVRLAARALNFEAEIHETHHVHKQDAPSGTALKLGEAVAVARGLNFDDVLSYEPESTGRVSAPGDIRFEVERRGEVPGDHTVIFRSARETLSLTHSVTSRDVFADGALAAAKWLCGRAPGLYSMQDVLEPAGSVQYTTPDR